MLRVEVFLVGLAVVYAQESAQHCLRDQVKHDCIRGQGLRVYNSGSGIFWDPEYEENIRRNNGLNCIHCCPYDGTTLPLCKPRRGKENNGNHERNNGIQNIQSGDVSKVNQLQHCLRTKVKSNCRAGHGRRIRNSGPSNVWDPAYEEDLGVEPGFNCLHCCLEEEKTLQACSNVGLRSTTQLQDDVEGQRRNRNKENLDQQQHCLRTNVKTKCQLGPGRRIRNSGPSNVWDPAYEQDLGVDPGWNCIHCCLDEEKTLQACSTYGLTSNTQQRESEEDQRRETNKENVEYDDGWEVEENFQNEDGWEVDFS